MDKNSTIKSNKDGPRPLELVTFDTNFNGTSMTKQSNDL